MPGTGQEASSGERALTELLLRSRLTAGDGLPELVAAAARHIDGSGVVLHLVDHAQVALVPFGAGGEPSSIDGTVVGRAFTHVEVVDVALGDGRVRVHLPLLDSVERVGTLSLTVPAEHDRERLVALLLRGGHVVKRLGGPAEPPFGLGLRTRTTVHEERLEPGDRILGHTDGVIEATDAEGRQFGLERLVDLVVTAEAAGVHAPETMRRVSRAVLEHGAFRLCDDATHLLVEWLTGEPARLVL